MRPVELHSCLRRLRTASFLVLVLTAVAANAAGPRWVTGSPYFSPVPAGRPVVWSTTQLSYFTDAGDLSASVDHASADALVAAAVSVWNVPTSAIVLSHGGTLAEDVSSANTSISNGNPVYPPDVQATSYAAIPIALIYDSDGAITDMLLGSGASDPVQCRQNGVLERVDSITPFGAIQHAVLILNGRCSGPAPEQQLQLQYQLERAFGRILGLAWSQLNDNVFTQWRSATDDQKLHWPIMHPIDIACGTYTYQCLPQPFTLRDDDVASISSLYPVTAPAPSGKVVTYQNAARITGTIAFPTGEGMQGVNVVVKRVPGGSATPQDYQDTSSVSGFLFQQNAGNPVTGAPSGISGSQGSTDTQLQGFYDLAWIPEVDPLGSSNGSMSVVVSTEPINPLYVGEYAVGPYPLGAVAPSGSSQSATTQAPPYDGAHPAVVNFNPSDAASTCAPADGTESVPTAVPSSGAWSSLLCGRSHSAWSSISLAAQRTATIEATALDETGTATTAKAMPLIGAWARSDLMGSLPTLTATQSAFNTIALGVTAAHVYTAQATDIRFAITDARGDGRPDFPYRARVLYAAHVQPATIPLSGGPVTITGTGFTAAVQVKINGATATILQSSSTSLVVTAPASLSARAVDVAVIDPTTGGSSTMYSALTYSTQTDVTTLMPLRPIQYVAAGTAVTWQAQMIASENGAPAAGVPVTWTGSSSITFASATTVTNAAGLAQSTATVAPLTAGTTVTAQACAWTNVCGSISAVAVDRSAWRVVLVSGGSQSIGSSGTFSPVVVRITDTAGDTIAGAQVMIHQTVTAAAFPCPTHGACPIGPTLDASVATATSDADGLVSITPLQMQGTAENTNIVAATGTQGFLQLSLQETP